MSETTLPSAFGVWVRVPGAGVAVGMHSSFSTRGEPLKSKGVLVCRSTVPVALQYLSFDRGEYLRYTATMFDKMEAPQGQDVSVVILAGGQSRRLGMDKSLLELGGRSLIARTVDKLAVLSDDVVVVTNNQESYEHLALGARFVPDEQPGGGALMGVYSGLKASVYESALVVACDMPFLSVALLRYMLPRIDGYDVVMPRHGGFLEPLHAIYSKRCLPFIEELLEQGRKQIVAFLDHVEVDYIEAVEIARFDPEHLSFLNVNSPAEWQLAQELLARREET